MQKSINRREIHFIRGSILATAIIFLGIYGSIARNAYNAMHQGDGKGLFSAILFAVMVFFLAYGNFLYQFCLVGYFKRKIKHSPATRGLLESYYEGKAPSVAILIPSYKEELSVVRQTMLSAALSEYPNKAITLLIDDPYAPRALEDLVKLEKTRKLSEELQALFDKQLTYYRAQETKFIQRCKDGNAFHAMELNRLSLLYESIAEWLEELAANFQNNNNNTGKLTYSENFFRNRIVLEPAAQHREFAKQLRDMLIQNHHVSEQYLSRQYKRLSTIFNVSFSHFERKKYVNLSQESNKAMNLNSYIGLMGRSWREVKGANGLELQECALEQADMVIHGFDYVNTIDADTLMTSNYILHLIHEMEKPGHERVAVAQSPCSTIPDCPELLARAAGVFIDIGFMLQQGYTHWNVGFWVGANAILRRTALEDIRETRMENGHEVAVYIQDRTVIEDTESSVDLLFRGWKVYNYPERMTFSPTPPDFGSLLIQRRRWANGGLIILPKLFGYMVRAPKSIKMLKESFIHFYYLAAPTISCITIVLLGLYPFGKLTANPLLSLLALQFFFLLIRNINSAGYARREVFNVCAANIMLLPVNIGGVLKQFQQMATRKKIPFGRTPKVPGRTSAPLLYYALEIGMLVLLSSMTMHSIRDGQWLEAVFIGGNTVLAVYAIIHFIGLKSMAQDLSASVSMEWRKVFHHAEIIPLPTRILSSGSAFIGLRKRARA